MNKPALPLSLHPAPGGQARAMIGAFIAMPWRDKLTLLAAWLLIGVLALGLRLFGFRPIARLLGTPAGTNAFIPLISDHQARRARLVMRAVRRAARIAPSRSDCLPQVLTGAVLCRLLGVPTTAFLGVRLAASPAITAHAWLCAGPVPVTGGSSFGDYAVTLCFAAPLAALALRQDRAA